MQLAPAYDLSAMKYFRAAVRVGKYVVAAYQIIGSPSPNPAQTDTILVGVWEKTEFSSFRHSHLTSFTEYGLPGWYGEIRSRRRECRFAGGSDRRIDFFARYLRRLDKAAWGIVNRARIDWPNSDNVRLS